MRLSAAGIVAEAPMPEKARRTINVVLSREKPMPRQKMPTQAKPTTKVHLAEYMSLMRPACERQEVGQVSTPDDERAGNAGLNAQQGERPPV